MYVILDTAIVTLLVTESAPGKEPYRCKDWLMKLLARGASIAIPEICIYEVKRGILYVAKKKGKDVDIKLRNLENLGKYVNLLPLDIDVLSEAAFLWSEAMISGLERPKGVDVDMLVLAHQKTERYRYPGRRIVVATKNLRDFRRFDDDDAMDWEDINF
jgi:predicted nucleic acid-binding protein